MIDTLAIAKKLRGTKLDPADAETIAEAIALGQTTSLAELATKADLAEIRSELGHLATKIELAELRSELKQDIAQFRGELTAEIAKAKNGILVWLVGLNAVAFSIANAGLGLLARLLVPGGQP